jgi:hypothetical protein
MRAHELGHGWHEIRSGRHAVEVQSKRAQRRQRACVRTEHTRKRGASAAACEAHRQREALKVARAGEQRVEHVRIAHDNVHVQQGKVCEWHAGVQHETRVVHDKCAQRDSTCPQNWLECRRLRVGGL